MQLSNSWELQCPVHWNFTRTWPDEDPAFWPPKAFWFQAQIQKSESWCWSLGRNSNFDANKINFCKYIPVKKFLTWKILHMAVLQPRLLISLGPIHTGRAAQGEMQRKQIGPVVVNGSVHTARKHHQRKKHSNLRARLSRVLCELGLKFISKWFSVVQPTVVPGQF